MYEQVPSSSPPRSIQVQRNYDQLHHFIVNMHSWPLYVGQRSDAHQCHMTCMSKPIHHLHQVWPRSIQVQVNYDQLCHFIVKMHIWPLYLGQRSDGGQCHMTCAGSSIHHPHQVWWRSIKVQLNYGKLCYFIVQMHIWPLNVGQRSNAGEHHMTCAGVSIYHIDQVWWRSTNAKSTYV